MGFRVVLGCHMKKGGERAAIFLVGRDGKEYWGLNDELAADLIVR